MKKFLLAVMAFTLVGCSDGTATVRALEGAGYKDVVPTGYSFFGCSQEDTMATGFKATDQSGRRISGVYCSGLLFKGGTIRID